MSGAPPRPWPLTDLRRGDEPDDPWPATVEVLERALAELGSGRPYKAVLEELLRSLPHERADAFMLLLKESRGAFGPLVSGGGGRALLVGNALSGTAPALVATAGVELVQLDRSPLRAAFAAWRDAELTGELAGAGSRCVAGGDGPRLPFEDGEFDLVVVEEGLPGPGSPWGFGLDELARVTRGELLLTVDNRFGYKRSRGRRGRYRLAGPRELLGRLLRPPAGEHTLRGYRRLLARHFPRVRTFALYPHTRDFTHVVGLGHEAGVPRPRLTIGPRERRNVVKLAGYGLGLFPHLAPSFLVQGSRGDRLAEPPRIARVLDALAERLGEPRPRLDVWVATRSNTALLHTLPAGTRGVGTCDLPADLPREGRWTIHVPLNPRKRALVLEHRRFLERVRAEFPEVPVPEPLFAGQIEGLWVAVERRLVGITAPHLTGRRGPTARLLRESAEHMARLVLERRRLDAGEFEELLAGRFERVAENCGRADTAARVRTMARRLAERLVGRELPLCVYHGDLRGKHVQVDRAGHVVGFLDWGAAEDRFLPLVDVLHLLAHQRKQEEGSDPRRTWDLLRERRGLRPDEREALEHYVRLVGLDEEATGALIEAYPILVAGMAERNWDYSRPFWVHQSFGI